MDYVLNLLGKPVTDLDERIRQRVIKFLKFVPQLIKHGNYSQNYNKESLREDINNYEIRSEPMFTFEWNYFANDTCISREEYRLLLLNTNFLNVLSFCYHMLFNYVKFCIGKVDETSYKFLATVINHVIKTYDILLKNSYWLQLNQVSDEIDTFLKFLVENVLDLDLALDISEKHGYQMKILILFKKNANCRNIVIDLIDKELIRYLYRCQNEVEQDYVAPENVAKMLTVLKVMLEYKYNPKEEILKTLVISLSDQEGNSSRITKKNNLTDMLKILIQYVPKNVKLLVQDCINLLQPE